MGTETDVDDQYDFTISEHTIAPDGYLTNVTIINGQFPGPTIEANWGDTIRRSFDKYHLTKWSLTTSGVTVHNNLTNLKGTSFHWHGIRQFQTNFLDGVPGVTQCPAKVSSLVNCQWAMSNTDCR